MMITLCRHKLQWVPWQQVDPSKSFFRAELAAGEAEPSQTKEGAENQPHYTSPFLHWHEVGGGVEENVMNLLIFFEFSP